MDFRGKKYERGTNWSDPEVVELLHLWADESVQAELESCLRNQHVFNRIAEVLREKGIHRTGDQCREKIKKMKLEYRRIKDNNKAPRGGRTWKFYEVMDRVLASRPPLVYSATGNGNGGYVLAQQGIPGGVVESYHPHLGPSSALTFPPSQPAEQMEIKCEEVDSEDQCLMPEPLPSLTTYQPCGGSAEEQEIDRAFLERSQTDSPISRVEVPIETTVSLSGFREPNAASSSRIQSLGAWPGFSTLHRLRKKRKGQRLKDPVDALLLKTLSAQREMEERFLQMEERRLQRDLEVEERRIQLEQRRFELERDHDFRMFNVFAQMLSVLKQGNQDSSATGVAPNVDLHQTFSSSTEIGEQLSEEAKALQLGQTRLDSSTKGLHADFQSSPYLSVRGNMAVVSMSSYKAYMLYHADNVLEEVARFLTYYSKAPAPLKAENVILQNGCGSLFSSLAMVLCDPGGNLIHKYKAFLIATPFYGGIIKDVYLSGRVKLVYAYLDSQVTGSCTRPFQLTVDKLKKALQDAQSEGIKVRGLILLNPQNPLGDIYSLSELQDYLEFAKRHELHVIVDEIYMLSVFDDSATFHSVLEMDRLPDPQRTHVLWGISKDFAMSGVRFGVLYTLNQDVIKAVTCFNYVHSICGPMQYQIIQLLKDRDWINQYLRKKTFEEEMLLWRRFLDKKILLSPGNSFECNEPGWFRIIFADKMNRLRLGMQRICEVLEEQEHEILNEDKDQLCLSESEGTVDSTDEVIFVSHHQEPTSSGSSTLGDLIGLLQQQMRSSDWLQKNTVEQFAQEKPEVYDVFSQLVGKK
ncbi:hypothetical protein Chor_016552 [Crotalus horridus]